MDRSNDSNRIYLISITIFWFSWLQSPGLSQVRPEPDAKFGLGRSSRFYEAQALGSQAKPDSDPNITMTISRSTDLDVAVADLEKTTTSHLAVYPLCFRDGTPHPCAKMSTMQFGTGNDGCF